MTTNQTIDGVPRKSLEQALKLAAVFDDGGDGADAESARGVVWILRALLDKEVSGDSRAPQHQGDHLGEIVEFGTGLKEVSWRKGKMPALGTKLYAEHPAPVAVVPDGYCIMPRQLTAENGAKALLLGEFKLLVTKECPECCELEEPTEGCSICDGEGEYGQKHTIPWDQIKCIYSKAISGLAVKTQLATSR